MVKCYTSSQRQTPHNKTLRCQPCFHDDILSHLRSLIIDSSEFGYPKSIFGSEFSQSEILLHTVLFLFFPRGRAREKVWRTSRFA